jgi:hypothetical protein
MVGEMLTLSLSCKKSSTHLSRRSEFGPPFEELHHKNEDVFLWSRHNIASLLDIFATGRWLLEFATERIDAEMGGKTTGQQVEGRSAEGTPPGDCDNREYGSISCEWFAESFILTPSPELWKGGLDCLSKALCGAESIMDDI